MPHGFFASRRSSGRVQPQNGTFYQPKRHNGKQETDEYQKENFLLSLKKRQQASPKPEPRRRDVAIASRAHARKCDEKALQKGTKPTSLNEPFPPQAVLPV